MEADLGTRRVLSPPGKWPNGPLMTAFTVIFLLLNAAALLALPRRLALLPLLVGCCYMTVSQQINAGPVTLTVIRILVAVGIMRVIVRGERVSGGICGMDKLMLCWAIWLVLSSSLHPGDKAPLVFNLGQAFNIGGIYILIRVFCATRDELVGIIKLIAWLLLPIALEMVSEHFTGRNMFSIFGGIVQHRDDKFRAVGPFAHSILAGSVGAACLPLMVAIWKNNRLPAAVGITACVMIVIASNSSGPLMSLVFGIMAILLWTRREWMRYVRWGIVVMYLLLELVMDRPAYYIIGEIDLTGSSTGWHRARLIESCLNHIGEWWLAGTNFTRHWMPTGVSWSPDHCDITNYYVLMGVFAGLPLVLLFVAMIWTGFVYIGRIMDETPPEAEGEQFIIWCVGSALFAHTATCISVAYFDQSYIFMFLCLAATASLRMSSMERVSGTEPDAASGEAAAPSPAC
jgi:hypothetical protein